MLAWLADPIETFDFDALRAEEFSRLDDQNIAYLDYTASALYGASQARAYAELLTDGVFGNPHSEHAASRNSSLALAAARSATLAFFDGDPDIYDVCFTANTTAALKLVGESYPFGSARGLILSADNHNSVNGIRAFARRAGAPVSVLPLDDELRLDRPTARLRAIAAAHGPGLFAFPLQSNFSGVQHDVALIDEARLLDCDVLIDAAGGCASSDFSLRVYPADFVACSFYKLFGLPTGVGALIARKTALARLARPWFSGGTVAFVSVEHERHALLSGHAGFEDGTPNFLDLAALEAGFAFLNRIPRTALCAHMKSLVRHFLDRATDLRHANGTPLVRLYGPRDTVNRGGTVPFNLLDRTGQVIPYHIIEQRARNRRVAIRGGCFCNPGAAETAFGYRSLDAARCLDRLDKDFSVPAFHACMGGEVAVGAIRLSVGLPTNASDIDRAIDFCREFS